jgi:hypothetical protein
MNDDEDPKQQAEADDTAPSADDVPKEMVDAARQESEYPGDETDEG